MQCSAQRLTDSLSSTLVGRDLLTAELVPPPDVVRLACIVCLSVFGRVAVTDSPWFDALSSDKSCGLPDVWLVPRPDRVDPFLLQSAFQR